MLRGSDHEDEIKDDDEDPALQNNSADAILRDYRYQLQCTLMASNRDLKVQKLLRKSSFC